MALQNQHLFTLTASEVQRLISSGSLTLEGYVSSLIARYRERDEHVNAWACIEPERVLEEARQLDQELPEKRGRLHGFVIGVKDVMTTKGELRGCVAGNTRGSMLTAAQTCPPGTTLLCTNTTGRCWMRLLWRYCGRTAP